MIPADLLDKLREKDPELWEKYKQWSAHMDIYDETALQYILQGELQEAIRARGWGYHIRISRGHEIVSTIIGTGKRASDYFSEEGSTEVEALLRAYLAAIHGEKA